MELQNHFNTLIELIGSFEHRPGTALVHRGLFRSFPVSYRELYRRIRRGAALYSSLGLKESDRVVIRGQNGPSWCTAFLSAIWAGLIPVPVDFRSIPTLLRETESASGASFSIVNEEKLISGNRGITLDRFARHVEASGPEAAPADAGPDGIAAILYTSGTTGKPKGVKVTHRNILSNVSSLASIAELDSDEIFLSILPLSHLFEETVGFFLPLSLGHTIVYPEILKPSVILQCYAENGITVSLVVPGVLEVFRSGIEEKLGMFAGFLNRLLPMMGNLSFPMRKRLLFFLHRRFPSLKHFVCGGAALHPDLERWWERCGFLTLPGYGLTETGPVISCNTPTSRKVGTLGPPVPGVETVISDEGELKVRGPNVTPGYFQDEEETGKKIVNGWFHTGDVIEKDAEGYLIFRGRLKEMIVTASGMNVYPEDIEDILKQFPGITDAAVVPFCPEAPSREEVHAALILEGEVDASEIVRKCNETLSEYQRIKSFTIWPDTEFPKTPTLKVRRKSVLDRLRGIALPETISHPAESDSLIARLSERSRISPDAIREDSRLGEDLGMDSLARMETALYLEELVGAPIDELAITETTTVAEVRRILEGIRKRPARRPMPYWAATRGAGSLRNFCWSVFFGPVCKGILSPFEVSGLENLAGISEPCVYTPNHASYLDGSAVQLALPSNLRKRLAIATWAEYFEPPRKNLPLYLWKRIFLRMLELWFNIYPLPQKGGLHQSLEYTGHLLEKGFSILFFPEGKRTTTGEMDLFRPGISFIAKELRIPVVPVYLDGLFEVFPPSKRLPRKGRARVVFGRPIPYATLKDLDHTQAAELIRTEVMKLGKEAEKQRSKEAKK